MLGMIGFQRADRSRAIDLYRQAIAFKGRVAANGGNLGNAYLEEEPAQAAEAGSLLPPRPGARTGLRARVVVGRSACSCPSSV
jgi:hypothetical protein